MAFSSGVFTGTANSWNDAEAGDIIDPADWNTIYTELETAFNVLSKGTFATKSDVASATTCNIGAATTRVVRITGTTTITSLGTVADCHKWVYFADAVLLTHNATSLILPGGGNLTTSAGTCAEFISDASGNWRCFNYLDPTAGPGNVTGPGTSTDNAAARFDSTTGELLQNSSLIISDNADLTAYDATNDGNPVFAFGAAATERLTITPTYDSGAQTLDYVLYATDVASATADKGLHRFNVDGTAILDIDDGGINFAASKGISIAGTDIITDSAGTATLSNIDALDATTEATIEAAIDTLANLTSIQGNTVTLTGAFIRSGAHSLTLTTSGATDVTLPTTGTLSTLAGAETLSNKVLTLPQINDTSSDHQYVFAVSELAADRTVTLPLLAGNDTFAFADFTQTLANKTLTAPKIADAGFIADANGNELLIFTTTASAVNEVTFANGSTGVNPKFTASGEANVGIDFQAKGSGVYRFLATASQAAELRLYEDTDDGSNYVAFKAPTLAGNVVYTLPIDDGTASQFLQTDGSGVLAWSTPAGSGDVSAASNFGTDNVLIRADGTTKGVQSTGVSCDDSNNLTPTTSDAAALGTGTLMWSDLFLASGSVVNWNNGDLTLTHGSNILTLAGGDLSIGTSAVLTAGTIELGAASDTTLSRSAAGVLAVEGVIVKNVGKETVWIPAGAMTSRTTNGAAAGTAEMTTNKNMFKTLDFDTTTQEFAQFEIHFPKSWNLSTVTFQPVWSHAATATNFGVVWGLAGVARSDDDAGDVAFGTAQTSTDTGGTTNDIYIGPECSAITIAGTPAAGDTVQFQINRTVSDASDTMAIDARLHGIRLFYTTNAATDA